MKIAGLIQARVGSQRCKNKMLREFGDTNLVTLALGKFSGTSDLIHLYFAAYEPELLNIGSKYDCTIIRRDKESATADKIRIVMNYLDRIEEDYIMFINACHPFLSLDTLEKAIEYFEQNSARSLTAVVRSNTWYYHLDGAPINYLDSTVINTKATSPVYEVTHSFHIFEKKRFIEEGYFWRHTGGDPVFFEIPENENVDIDTEWDFEKAEAIFNHRQCNKPMTEHKFLTKVKLVVMDVDGVLTDAGMYYSDNGDELKKFNTRDGMGIKKLREAGVKLAIITSEDSDIVARRATKLKIEDVYLGVEDKGVILRDLMNKYSCSPDEVLYIGDDLNDLTAFSTNCIKATVSDGADELKQQADIITAAKGGEGAVREISNMILQVK